MRLAWATDVHLNFVDEARVADFCERIDDAGAECLLLGGDIAEAHDLEHWLRFVERQLQRPIYFVLGNHDYYAGDIEGVRNAMRELDSPFLHWLPRTGVVRLTDRTSLVGHGGWGDARHGDFANSPVVLSDYLLIEDLRNCTGGDGPCEALYDKFVLKNKLAELGDDAAACLRPLLLQALQQRPHVLVLTHVPPFRESCWYDGRISNDHWLPGFTCKAMGDMLLEVLGARPQCHATVLCGHTHGDGESRPLPNIFVRTGGARYREPDFRLLEIGDGEPRFV